MPIDMVVATTSEPAALGRMWRNMMRSGRAPSACAARVKSRALSDSVSARTSRATVVQPVSATMTTMR